MEYLIFDFDGVLGNSKSSWLEVIQKMEVKSAQEVATANDAYFTKSPHTRDLNLSREALETLTKWVTKGGNLLHQKGFDLFSGFIKEIKKIKRTKIAVVSSGSYVYIKPRLEKSGLEFTHILSFEDHHSKEEKVEQICKDWEISVKDAYFFTDTVSDVKELGNVMDKNKIYGC